MEERRVRKFKIEDAKLIFKNFKGEASDFNRNGERNFGVLLDDGLAEDLEADGWHVKYRKPKLDDPDQYCQPWLSVKVKFGKYPPEIWIVDSRGKVLLEEDTVGQLDWTIMKTCDLVIRPYSYPAMPGRPAGISAYLQELTVVVDEDAMDSRSLSFRKKYEDIPIRKDEVE